MSSPPTNPIPLTRDQVTEIVRDAKRKSGLSWKDICAKISDASPVYVTAALLGQMPLSSEEAGKAVALLGLPEEVGLLLAEVPYRGSLPTAVPTDPLIYRFYELVSVYGTTWKELIQEEFGDGIMSAIDFDMTMDRKEDPKGDRVQIVMTGKFLSYKRY
jgi:cyanate lyase